MSATFSISPETINPTADAPSREINPEISALNPMDLVSGEKLLVDFSQVFPEGFVRKKSSEAEAPQTIMEEESPDEKIVRTLFTKTGVDARYGDAIPEKLKGKYELLEADIAQLQKNPETSEKVLSVQELIRRYIGDEEEVVGPDYTSNADYMEFLYSNVVRPYLLEIGQGKADLDMARAEIRKIRERAWSADPEKVESKPKSAVTTLRDSLSGSGDVPHQKVLDYYDSKIRRYS